MGNMLSKWGQISLVKRIIIGLIVGIILAVVAPNKVNFLTIFGSLFVGALRGVAPMFVFLS